MVGTPLHSFFHTQHVVLEIQLHRCTEQFFKKIAIRLFPVFGYYE